MRILPGALVSLMLTTRVEQAFTLTTFPTSGSRTIRSTTQNASPNYTRLHSTVEKTVTQPATPLKKRITQPGKAWRANYQRSSKTQKKIKLAGKQRASPIVRASSVIRAFLTTDPVLCNPSNVVCALTLSAKIVPKNAQRRHEFRGLLHDTCDILHRLVKKRRLNTRQLANAAWALAKHYSNDELVLPPSFHEKNFVAASDGSYADAPGKSTVSIAERLDLKEDEKYQTERRVLETLDEIAHQLTEIMTPETNLNGRKGMNEVELAMVCWAYSVVYPRHVPAGWELPPRVGQMETGDQVKSGVKLLKHQMGDEDEIIFETIQDSGSDCSSTSQRKEEEFRPTSTVDKLFDAMAKSVVIPQSNGRSMLQQCDWKEISTIAWSFANRGYCKSSAALNLILNLADLATARIEKSSWFEDKEDILPRDVTEIAWALGVMQSDNHNLSDSLDHFTSVVNDNLIDYSLDRPLEHWKSADCVQMAIALGHGRLDRKHLLLHIFSEALASMRESLAAKDKKISQDGSNENFKFFGDVELVALLWVQARLYLTVESGQVFDDFVELIPQALLYRMHMANDASSKSVEEIQQSLQRIHLGQQEQANLVWSMAVLEKHNSRQAVDLLRNIFTVCAATCKQGNLIRLEHAHQFWQSIFILEEECPEAIETVDAETRQFLKKTWEQEKSRQKTSSARHLALSETLNFMGVKHYNEHDEDIDLALVIRSDSKWTNSAEHTDSMEYTQRVAVEFDGPTHFTKLKSINGQKADPPRALGHTVLKYKLLKKQGWTIVRIPFYEFDRIPFWASMERQRYLQRKLKTHANLKFSVVDISEYKAPVPKDSRFD
eukprot:scaffold162_cov267-Chaetoceros_neogracile.AAC.17